jgi:CRP/FNR family transcriptional regulator, cyclic AMP receptor protein
MFSVIYTVGKRNKRNTGQSGPQTGRQMSPSRQTDRSSRGRKITPRAPVSAGLRAESSSISPSIAAKKRDGFDPHAFLATIGEGRRAVLFRRKQGIFTQGDTADAVFYIQTGKVKLTVVSKTGKKATIGLLSEGDFFGEGSLAGQPLRMGSATALTDCASLRIEKKAMMEALHREHEFSDLFVAYLLSRNIRYEEDLVDQLFNSSEKRLARPLAAGSFWQGRDTRDRRPQDQPGDAGGNDRHNPLARQLLHEPVQKIGIYSLQRRATSPQLAAQYSPARLAVPSAIPQETSSRLGSNLACVPRHAERWPIGSTWSEQRCC